MRAQFDAGSLLCVVDQSKLRCWLALLDHWSVERVLRYEANLELMRKLDEIDLRHLFIGFRLLHGDLPRDYSVRINRNYMQRLIRMSGIRDQTTGARSSRIVWQQKTTSCLLQGLAIVRVNWIRYTDITYFPLREHSPPLCANMVWNTRKMSDARLLNCFYAAPCIEAREERRMMPVQTSNGLTSG